MLPVFATKLQQHIIITCLKKGIIDIKRILNISERRRFVVLVLLNVLLSVADISSIALVFIVLNIYSGQSVTSFSPILQQLHITGQSLEPAIFLIVVFVLKSIAGYFITKAQFRYISNVATRLAEKSLLLYLEGSYEDHVNIDSSVLQRRICFQPLEFAQYILSGIQQAINEFILIIISVTALALFNLKLLVIVVIVLLPAVFILYYITKKRLSETRKNIQTSNEISLQYLNETIAGFIESNIYNKNAFFVKRYKQSRFIVNRFIADMQVTQVIPGRFFETFAVIGLFVLLVVLRYNAAPADDNFLMLGAFVAAAYKIIPGISKIINYHGQVKTYFFTVNELTKDKNVDIKKSSSYEHEINNIAFRNIQFSYGDVSVFDNLNCNINKNSFVGISGKSGKGKTTLIDLLLGFLSPASGSIFINGNRLNSDDIKNFWPQIAYVKQTAFLLHDSIFQNIVLYEKDIDEKRLNEVLEVTGLKDWLSRLPDGMYTKITESGKNISGGQRQRIAIARALFKNASLIILDEPFNELDEASEMSLLHYFKQLTSLGKTVLLVTHNTNSFSLCDDIIYLDETA